MMMIIMIIIVSSIVLYLTFSLRLFISVSVALLPPSSTIGTTRVISSVNDNDKKILVIDGKVMMIMMIMMLYMKMVMITIMIIDGSVMIIITTIRIIKMLMMRYIPIRLFIGLNILIVVLSLRRMVSSSLLSTDFSIEYCTTIPNAVIASTIIIIMMMMIIIIINNCTVMVMAYN